MGTTSLTGQDTMVIGGRVLNDLPDGDVTKLTYADDIVKVKKGKNGNAIYAFNASGEVCDVEQRVLKGSDDDKFLNSQLQAYLRDKASYVLLTGSFVKTIGDGLGNLTKDTYLMSGGIVKKPVDAKDNVDGDTEQAVSVYSLIFTNAPRSLT